MTGTRTGNGTIDISKADTVVCEKCDNRLFIQSFVIKKISAILSPSGQEAIVPVQVYSCGNCGSVPKMFEAELTNKKESK
jgi:predicted RNA methylase